MTKFLLLAISLLSPIDTLSGFLFAMHMVQHLLMVMFAPPLLMIANPFRAQDVSRFFATHPPMGERVARLEAMASGRHGR